MVSTILPALFFVFPPISIKSKMEVIYKTQHAQKTLPLLLLIAVKRYAPDTSGLSPQPETDPPLQPGKSRFVFRG